STMANKEDLTANDYFAAGSYYFAEGMNMEQAKEWVDKAVEMGDGKAFWMMRTQSLIYAKMGDKKAAIEAAKKSMAAAQAAGNQDYVKMNKDSLKEWAEM
ncbi:MAG TPA: dihydrolipoamide dehydrogenase, partial [Muricauda sp.]|nr:dihydrolipoamide dehydrogenase [Allomuricauda sp.]